MPIRFIYLSGLVVIIALLGISICLQVFASFMPCPLCTLQRIDFAILGILFFIALFFHKKNWQRLTTSTLVLLLAIAGIGLAGRQVYLQHLTSGNTECGVSLQYMMRILPLNEVIKKVLAGSAECSQRGFEFLHFSLAEWSLIWFILFLLMGIYLFLREIK